MHTIVISSNTSWSIFNFRLNLIGHLSKECKVVVISPDDHYTSKLRELGIVVYTIPMAPSSINTIQDVKTLVAYFSLIRKLKPDYYLGFTAKPNIYGGFIASLLGVKVVNNIAGLGRTFSSKSPLKFLMNLMYKVGLSKSHHVFFQNNDDRALFLNSGIVNPYVTSVLPGSGVNIDQFIPGCNKSLTEFGKTRFTFLFSSRLLLEKGILEYIAAARIVREQFIDVDFKVLGKYEGTPNEIDKCQLELAILDGVIEYLGVTDDVVGVLNSVQCFVLPSYYREGVPRSLLEAGSCGLPLITTNSVGCRETVIDGINGFLIEPRSVEELVQSMLKMISLSSEDRISMGLASRNFIKQYFDERIVLERYSELIR